jgi:hypothetical protein
MSLLRNIASEMRTASTSLENAPVDVFRPIEGVSGVGRITPRNCDVFARVQVILRV